MATRSKLPVPANIAYHIRRVGERWGVYRRNAERPACYAPTLADAKSIVKQMIKSNNGVMIHT